VRIGIDTNVLIYAHLPAFPEHAASRAFLGEQLRRPDRTVVVTALVLHEFVHVVTDPRRFEPPLQMAEALAVARRYLGRSNVECLPVDEDGCVRMIDLLERHRLGRNRVADTLFAATFLTHGVRDLATCDPEGYRPFEELRLVDPRGPGDPDGSGPAHVGARRRPRPR
jgi:hypothetical protein